jgi:hypothetical protein
MFIQRAALLSAALLLSSCAASYSSKTRSGLEAFQNRNFAEAEKVFSDGADKESVNQLLYLFDRGTSRHSAGDYAGSIKDLLNADKLSEIKDYTSLATELASIVTNDNIIDYKGEEFETVLVSTLLAINYALLGKDEDALVECRRVNRKLERLRSEGKRTYALNAFAQYLSGVLYERSGNWNSAYVDYKKAWDLKPEFSSFRSDLLRGALESDSDSERDRWERQLKAKPEDFKLAAQSLKKTGSLVVIYQNGFAPEKIVSPSWSELPEYRARFNKYKAANIYVDGKRMSTTELLYDVQDVAFKNLKEKYATYIAKRVAGLAVKVVAANQVEKVTGSEAAGTLALLLMMAASKPDLRAWMTLPQNLQMARLQLAPGKYDISLKQIEASGSEGPTHSLGLVEIKKPGQVVLANFRGLND